jgi:hypothetical protein
MIYVRIPNFMFVGFLTLASYIIKVKHFLLDELLDHWIDHDHLDHKLRQYMRDILLRKHKHSHVPRPKEEKKEAKRLESVGK